MIRINRPSTPPLVLTGRGQRETENHCAQYDRNSATHSGGEARFDSRIYSHESVRKKLIKCQHGKCCYSEGKFVDESVHVEHFRPKGAIGELGSKKKCYPGYYWLAYEWTNLLACKAAVNSKKGDCFPLVNENTRARSHHGDLCLETPMFIDPASEDPREHIRFHNEEPYGISDRGKFTVKWLLQTPALHEDRLEHFQNLYILKKAFKVLRNATGAGSKKIATCIENRLANAIKSHSKYSSMAIDLLD